MADTDFNIKIGATIDGLKEALEQGKKSVKGFSNSVEDVGKEASTALNELEGFGEGSLIFEKLNELTNGLAQEMLNVGKAINTAFKTGVQGANLFKVALASTGIGLIVVALGTIALYWDDIKGAVTGVNGALERQADVLKEKVELQDKAVKLINAQDNILKLQGKTQTEINNLKIGELKALIKIQSQLLTNQRTALEGAVKQEEAYRKLAQKLIAFAVLPAQALASSFDKVLGTDLAGKIAELGKKFADLITPDLTSDLKEEVSNLELEITKLENTIAGLQLKNNEAEQVEVFNVSTDGLKQGLVTAEGLFIAGKNKLLQIGEELGQGLAGIFQPISESWGASFNEGLLKVDDLTQQLGAKLKTVQGKVKQNTEEIGSELSGLSEQATAIVTGALTDAFTELGTLIGEALSGSGEGLKKTGDVFLKIFAGFLGSMGKLLISYGTLAIVKGTLDEIIKTGGIQAVVAGAGAVAIGVALVALSGAFGANPRGNAVNPPGGTGAGAGAGAGGASGGGVTTVSSTSGGGNGFGGTVVFEIAGTKLIGVLNNTLQADGRTGITT